MLPASQRGPPWTRSSPSRACDVLGYVSEASGVPPAAPLGVLRYDRSRARGGVDYVTVVPNCSAYIARPDGEVLRRWSHSPCEYWENGFLAPSGELVVVHGSPLPPDASLEQIVNEKSSLLKFDWDGRLLWERKLPVHHDVGQTPDGKIAVLTKRLKLYPKVHPTIPVRDHGIAILSSEGELLEQAWLMEIMARSPAYEPIPGALVGGKAKRFVNAVHANSIDWMDSDALSARDGFYSKDNVLVTMRAQNAVVLIHWPTRRIVWSWGHGELVAPHDAHLLPNGNILIFDNGNAKRRSRVVELDPLAKQIVWEYKGHDFYSGILGSAQRLPSGNTLVAVSESAEAFEVTPQGRIVWEFRNPEKGPKGKPAVIVRIRNYEPGEDLKPQAPSD